MITYNHEKFIAEAIEGVLMQEVDFEVELIIADDCSTDNTGLIVQGYVDNHPKGNWINYVRHSENKGMMGNFIWALNQCKGEFIALCEGDDYWLKSNKLLTQISVLKSKPDFSFSFHDCYVIDQNEKSLENNYLPNSSKKNLNFVDLIMNKLVPTCSVVFRKESLPNPLPCEFSYTINGDSFLFFLLSFDNPGFYHKDYLAANYRKHIGGVWSGLIRKDKHTKLLNTFFLINKINKPNAFNKYVWKKISYLSYELGKDYLKDNKKLSKYFFFQSIVYSLKSFQIKITLFSIIKLLKLL